MKESMQLAVNSGINVKANMILGFPFESRKEVLETMLFILSLAKIGIHDIYISCFAPYPGSEIYDDLVKQKLIVYMDNKYFFDLMTYSDLTFSKSYSKTIGNKELMVHRLGGMLLFYSMSYLFRPWRFFKTIFNIASKRQESRLEMTLNQMIRGHRSKKVKLPLAPLPLQYKT